ESNNLLNPLIIENENIQQIFSTIIDYDEFNILVYEDPTNPLLSGIMDFANPYTLLKKIFSHRIINLLNDIEEFSFNSKVRIYLESLISDGNAEKPTDSWISDYDLQISNIQYLATKKYEDKQLNINESTYMEDMFTSVMKDFCMEDADLISICGELETTCSHHHRQGLYKESNEEHSLILPEININAENSMNAKNFESILPNVDKTKQGHKIDTGIGTRLMKENLVLFLTVESKKPGTDPANDKQKQLQEQCDQINKMFCFYEDKFRNFITEELLRLMHNLFVIGARILDDQLEITVYDIPGSLIGWCRLFRQNIFVPSRVQLKHHVVDYLESLVGIK
ncbi:12682_t:CDS:2, partial [Dentiscutata erythropus]